MVNIGRLNKNRVEDIEHDISPPMKAVVTIPVDGGIGAVRGVVIYVASSPFGPPVSDSELVEIAKALRLEQHAERA